MSTMKRIGAALLAFATLVCVCCSCNQSNTKTILTVGDEDVPSGVYLLYLSQAIGELDEKIEDAGFTGDRWSYTDADVKNAKTWVKDTALEYTVELVAVEKKFAELGLSFTPDELSSIESNAQYYWDGMSYSGYMMPGVKDSYEKMGISYPSFLRVYKLGSMGGEIIESIYGKGGEKEITDDEYKTYMTENYSRVNHILISSQDEEGNELTGDALTEAETKAKDLLTQAQSADEETFRQLIIDNSKDYSEDSDLDLGYVAPLENSGYVTEFEDAIKALKPGETSAELCKSEYGWHIIRRYEMFGDDLVSLDDYRDTLMTTMKQDEYEALKAEWAKSVKYTLVKASFNRYDPTDKRFAPAEE